MSTSPVRPRGARAALTVLGVLAFVVFAAVLLWAVLPDHNADGQCEGIGWGCSLTPRDGVAFVGLLLGVPVGIGTALCAAGYIALAERRGWFPRLGGVGLGAVVVVLGLVTTLVVGGTGLLVTSLL